MKIQEDISLAPLTTFAIGGPARFFVQVTTVDELREALAFAKEKSLKVFFLGGGSNVLFDDAGFDGLVIQITILGVEESENIFIANSGESWDALVERAVKKNLWGIENLSGIPGTVGGAVVQNIGAYGAALSQTLQWVETYDTRTEEIKRLSLDECHFGYRGSIFKEEDGRYVVLRAALQLSAVANPVLSYKDLALRFKGATPSLQEIREAVLEIRRNKFPDLSIEGTAGSFFKNPIVTEAEATKLSARYPSMPTFPLPETQGVKIPLAWFLDYRNGVMDMRTITVGGARLYEKQPLALVAARNSSANDVKELARIVTEKIKEACDIVIEPEVRIVSHEK